MHRNDPRPYNNLIFVWYRLCIFFRKFIWKGTFKKSRCAHRGVKKKKKRISRCLFRIWGDRFKCSYQKQKKSACFPSPPASWSLVALVRAWYHSPWSGDHRQVALCSFVVINVTDGAWQWSLISEHSPTHLNQLHGKQRPLVLEEPWWAASRSTKFTETW